MVLYLVLSFFQLIPQITDQYYFSQCKPYTRNKLAINGGASKKAVVGHLGGWATKIFKSYPISFRFCPFLGLDMHWNGSLVHSAFQVHFILVTQQSIIHKVLMKIWAAEKWKRRRMCVSQTSKIYHKNATVRNANGNYKGLFSLNLWTTTKSRLINQVRG